MLAAIDRVQDIALTINAGLLASKATALAAAGLRRLTVSLDSLDDEVFIALNDARFPVARVLEAIVAAAGLAPVKVNMVVRRGCDEQSVLPMAAPFRHTRHVLRFIEYMDAGTRNGWTRSPRPPRSSPWPAGSGRWNRSRPAAPARSQPATATATAARSASSPRSPSRFAAAAPGPGSQPAASSPPACSPVPRMTCAACCAQVPATRRRASTSPAPGPGAPTAIPSGAPARPAATR